MAGWDCRFPTPQHYEKQYFLKGAKNSYANTLYSSLIHSSLIYALYVVLGFPVYSDGKESACRVGDLGLIPGLWQSPGGGHGNPL